MTRSMPRLTRSTAACMLEQSRSDDLLLLYGCRSVPCTEYEAGPEEAECLGAGKALQATTTCQATTLPICRLQHLAEDPAELTFRVFLCGESC